MSHSLFRPNVDIAALRALVGCLRVCAKLWARLPLKWGVEMERQAGHWTATLA